MSEGERLDSDRRTFLKQFAIGAAAVPFVTHGVFKFPDISGWGGGHGYYNGYGYCDFDDLDDRFG
jgi:hypothetical protein